MEEEIKIINKIIEEAVWHGADAGGSYDSNDVDLIAAINKWLIFKGLVNRYTVKEVITEDGFMQTYQIVPIVDDLSWLEDID